MNHSIILPVIVPLLAGALLVALGEKRICWQRGFGLLASTALLLISLILLQQAAQGQLQTYNLGNWPAPFGIVLVLDRLSALLLLTTAVLGFVVNLYAIAGDDRLGRYFHALLQFQLAGINGAFLTGDLFNLFVFFEILLIASYALLLHGCNQARLRSALHYVVLNLIGSSLFLLGAGLFYGVAGTLNMADLARITQQAQGDQRQLLQVAGWVMFLVFGLKAAFLPLHFWLPKAYASASGPVTALFAIMTKVGLYAILRLNTLIFAPETPESTGLELNVLFATALLTMLLGALGAFAADSLHSMLAYLVLVSVGALLAGISMGSEQALTATLFYLLHSTWSIAGLFLLADIVKKQRGQMQTQLCVGSPLITPNRLAALFFVAAIATIGLPPLSGFIGKLGLLQAATGIQAFFLWSAVILAGFLMLLAFSRTGSLLFWQQQGNPEQDARFSALEYFCALLLVGSTVVLALAAAPLLDYCQATAKQLLDTSIYLQPFNKGLDSQ